MENIACSMQLFPLCNINGMCKASIMNNGLNQTLCALSEKQEKQQYIIPMIKLSSAHEIGRLAKITAFCHHCRIMKNRVQVSKKSVESDDLYKTLIAINHPHLIFISL